MSADLNAFTTKMVVFPSQLKILADSDLTKEEVCKIIDQRISEVRGCLERVTSDAALSPERVKTEKVLERIETSLKGIASEILSGTKLKDIDTQTLSEHVKTLSSQTFSSFDSEIRAKEAELKVKEMAIKEPLKEELLQRWELESSPSSIPSGRGSELESTVSRLIDIHQQLPGINPDIDANALKLFKSLQSRLLPHSYSRLSVMLLDYVEKLEGRKKVGISLRNTSIVLTLAMRQIVCDKEFQPKILELFLSGDLRVLGATAISKIILLNFLSNAIHKGWFEEIFPEVFQSQKEVIHELFQDLRAKKVSPEKLLEILLDVAPPSSLEQPYLKEINNIIGSVEKAIYDPRLLSVISNNIVQSILKWGMKANYEWDAYIATHHHLKFGEFQQALVLARELPESMQSQRRDLTLRIYSLQKDSIVADIFVEELSETQRSEILDVVISENRDFIPLRNALLKKLPSDLEKMTQGAARVYLKELFERIRWRGKEVYFNQEQFDRLARFLDNDYVLKTLLNHSSAKLKALASNYIKKNVKLSEEQALSLKPWLRLEYIRQSNDEDLLGYVETLKSFKDMEMTIANEALGVIIERFNLGTFNKELLPNLRKLLTAEWSSKLDHLNPQLGSRVGRIMSATKPKEGEGAGSV